MPVSPLHAAHRLAVALRISHAEVAVRALLDVAPLLVPEERNGSTVEPPDTDHERRIVGAAAVAVQLDPVLEQPLDIVQRVGPVLMARQLDGARELLVGRRGLDALELALQLLELARQPCAAEQVEAAQARQPFAEA